MAVTTNELDIEIKAKSEQATASLDKLISKLNEVNTALNGLNTAKITEISNGIKGLKGVHVKPSGSGGGSNTNNASINRTRQLLDVLTQSSNRTNNSLLNFRGTMFKLAATWGTFYAAMYPAIRLLKGLGKDVQSSMNYVETYNYFLVSMNKIGHDSGEEYAKGFWTEVTDLNKKMSGFRLGDNGELFETGEKSLGLDPELIMQFEAKIGALTNSVGLLGQASTSTQKALSMLSSDLSSLKNEDLQSVMNNLSSGIIGQSRALYKYGIDITQATLKQYALEHGVTKSVTAMTQAEKMQLRLLAILDQSKVAWGDQANTISSVANQYRIMHQQISNVTRVMGNLFLPVVTKLLPYLNAFLITLRRIFTLLGMKLYGDNWLSDLNKGTSEGNFSGLAEDVDDVTDSIDGATKAAKKFKQATMGFDELNIISPQTSSGGGSGSGGGGGFDLSDDIDKALSDYEKVWNEAFDNMTNQAEEMANKFMSYVDASDWFGLGKWLSDSFADTLENIDWNRAYSGASQFGTGLAEFLNGLIQPRTFYDVGETVANSLNTVLYFALNFGNTFDFRNLGKSIGSGVNGFFENYDFKALAKTINRWVGGLEEMFLNAVAEIKWTKVFKGLYDLLANLDIHTVNLILGVAAIKGLKNVITSGIVKKLLAEKLVQKLGTIELSQIPVKVSSVDFLMNIGISALFTDALGKLLSGKDLAGHLMPKKGESQDDYIKRDYDTKNGDGSYEKMLKAQEDFDKKYRQGWENISKAFKENDLFAEIKKSYTENFASIPENFSIAIDNIKKNFGKLKEDFLNDMRTITDGISKGFTDFIDWWNVKLPTWWDNSVKPWFTKEKWSELGDNIKKGLSDKWNEFTEWWKKTGIYAWWTDHVEPFFAEDKWTFDGIAKGLKKSFQAALNGVKSLWNSFAEWINENLKWHIDPVEIGGKKIFDGADIQLAHLPKFNIPAYAIGGFPEDGLFMANHNELVGQFSNGQTAVANNEQIVEGIRSGVASAVQQTLAPYLRDIADNTSETANNTDAIAKKPTQSFTDRDIAKASIRGQRSMGLQLRTS